MDLDLWLDRLEQIQFVRRLNDLPSSYLFKHVLVQQSVYSSLLNKERKQLHRAVAEALEDNPDQRDELAAELAMHYEQAGEHAKAIAYYISSGERSTRISAYPEALHAYERALELTPADATIDRANLFVRIAKVHDRQSEMSVARENFGTALELARQAHQATTAATALCGLAWLATREGEHVQAQALAEQGLEWAHEAGDPTTTAQALRQLGIVYNTQGENDNALVKLQEALRLYRELDDLEGIAKCLNSLGVVSTDQRKFQAAMSYFKQALELNQKMGDRQAVGVRLLNLGVIAQEMGDYDGAIQYHEKALAIAKEVGDREGIAHVTLNLGSMLVKQNDLAGAMHYYRAALMQSIELGTMALALYVVAAVAEIHVKMGNYQYGAELLSFAFTHPAGTADIEGDFAFVLDALRTALSEQELVLALERGASLDLKQVTAEICGGSSI